MELADAARKKAGGPSKLARLFGVSKQAVNDWGRKRPVPRHLRKPLRALIEDDSGGEGPFAAEIEPSPPEVSVADALNTAAVINHIDRRFGELANLIERLIHAYDQNRQGRLRPRAAPGRGQ